MKKWISETLNPNLRYFWANNTLIFKTFVKQLLGILLAFILPLILLVVLVYIFYGISKYANPDFQISTTLKTLLPGLLLIPTLILGLLGLPFTFTMLKESNILKKVGTTPASPQNFIFSLVFTFVVLELFSSIFIFTLAKMFWQGSTPNPYNANFLLPWFISAFVNVGIGMLIGGICKTSSAGFGIGVAIFLPAIFLSGTLYPAMYGWISYISKAMPQNEVTILFKLSWNFGDLTISNKPPEFGDIVLLSNTLDTIYSYIFPVGSIFAFLIASRATFRWQ